MREKVELVTDPQFSNPLRRAIKSACCRSCTPRSLTRNELVKTWGRDEPNLVAVAGGAEDDATVTRTTVKLASSKVQQTDGDVPALQEREVALNMARGLETSRTCGIPPVFVFAFLTSCVTSESTDVLFYFWNKLAEFFKTGVSLFNHPNLSPNQKGNNQQNGVDEISPLGRTGCFCCLFCSRLEQHGPRIPPLPGIFDFGVRTADCGL